MAFLRYANAAVVQNVSPNGWGKIRTASRSMKKEASPSRSLVSQATEILGKPFNPSDYLLTHCTIVASVDTETPADVKLGQFKVGSKTFHRKYADYLIKPECSQFVNNNGDSWSRDTLLASYHTFIGGHNFLEHVQVEDLSKGRIIDAVARDIGDSVYVDILVATDRKHTDLVAKIESGELGTLSMGCTVDFTICTACGNVAVDETELCDHIKYQKLNKFLDENGKQRVIAELCGHSSYEETGGVTFIEASWVETPAFTGAVMRNILETSELDPATRARVAEVVLSRPPVHWIREDAMPKAASDRAAFGFGDEEEEDSAEEPAEEQSPLKDLQDDVEKVVVDKVKKRIRRQLDEERAPNDTETSDWQNDTLVKEAHLNAVKAMVRTASSDAALINGVAELDDAFGVSAPVHLYRVALQVGPTSNYNSLSLFLGECTQTLGRKPTHAEAKGILRLGKMLSVLQAQSN